MDGKNNLIIVFFFYNYVRVKCECTVGVDVRDGSHILDVGPVQHWEKEGTWVALKLKGKSSVFV